MQIRSLAFFATKSKCLRRKAIAKHRKPAFLFFPSGLVLNHVPMLHEYSILDSKNVRSDPIGGLAEAGESAMHDGEISVRHDHAWFIPKSRWQTFDEIEQSLAPRLDMRAVLDVAVRP